MRTETISIYKFSELSEKAKQRAIDKHQYKDFWYSDRKASYDAAKELYNKIRNIEGDVSGIRLYKFIQNNILPELRNRLLYYKQEGYEKGYSKYFSSKIQGQKTARFSKIQYNEEATNLTGYSSDYAFLEPIFDFLKEPSVDMTSDRLYNVNLDRIWETLAQEDGNGKEHNPFNYTYEEQKMLEQIGIILDQNDCGYFRFVSN